MAGAPTHWGSLGASVLGHAVLIAAAAGVGFLVHRDAPPAQVPRPVSRAADAPATSGQTLQLFEANGGTAAAVGEAIPLETADPRYRPYLIGVQRRIWERWHAPAPTGAGPALGTLVVEFTLTRSGRLAATGVSEPSGNPALDRAALAAVERADPFSPLPESIAGDALRVRARFRYD